MSSALLETLFALLGAGLAVTLTVCCLLWRRVRALTSAEARGDRLESLGEPSMTVALPKTRVEHRLTEARYEVARRLDDLAGRNLALEARLARIETSTTEAAIAILSKSRPARRIDAGHPTTSEGPTLISVPNLATPPSTTSEAAAELDRRFGPIWAMADEGTSTELIARETGYPIGQIELILGLRRQLLAGGTGPDG